MPSVVPSTKMILKMDVPRLADAIFTRLDASNLLDSNWLMLAATAVGIGLLSEST